MSKRAVVAVIAGMTCAIACGGKSGGHGASDAPGGGGGDSGVDAAPAVDAPCTSCAPLTTSWEQHYGGSGFDNLVEGVWVDGAGNTYITGGFDGTIDLGGGALTSAGLGDILVASFAPDGTYRWAQRFGGAMNDQGTSITVAAGRVYIAGTFTGGLELGGSAVTGAGGQDALILVLDAATGDYDTAFEFGTAGDDAALGIAVDGSGDITIVGDFATGTLSLAGSAITGAANLNAFVASFTPAGAHRWSRTLAGSAPMSPATSAFDDARAVAVDAAGSVTIAGEWMGTADFGSGAITSSGAANLEFDGFVASYTATGAPRWSRSFGAGLGVSAIAASLDASGNAVIGGIFHGTVDFGGTMLTQQGVVDGFALVLASATGATTMARSLGDTDASAIGAVRADSHGDVVAMGRMSAASTDLGNGVVLASAGGEDDVFVAGFDHATGTALFGHRWGGPGATTTYAEGGALALSVHDSMALGGDLSGPVDLGLGTLSTGSDVTGFAMLVTR
jgi:hypothetical protein